MIRNHFAKAGAIGSVSLGILAAMLAGCGSDAGPTGTASGSDVAGEKSAITQSGLVVNGCGAVGTFDITSPQFINFVALNQSQFQNSSMQGGSGL